MSLALGHLHLSVILRLISPNIFKLSDVLAIHRVKLNIGDGHCDDYDSETMEAFANLQASLQARIVNY